MPRSTPLRTTFAVLLIPATLGAGAVSVPPPPDGGVTSAPRALRLVTAETGNEARYRVREQLAGFEFPNDAVGETSAVTGTLQFADDGSIVADASKFVVALTTLKSDKDRRDNYIRRRTLETETYPDAVFAPTRVEGMPFPPPGSGEFDVTVVGQLTIHGETRRVVWEGVARGTGGGVAGAVSTEFTFADFGLEKPRVASVLSVRDTIRLELDFNLVADGS